MAPRRPWFAPLLLLFYTLLAVLSRIPVWQSPTTTLGGTGGDPMQMAWFLQWVPHALTHGQNPLLSYAVNVPDGTNMLWNTTMPAASFLLWPVTLLGNSFLTYNVVVTASSALAAWFAYFAIRRYVPNRWAAAAGGLIYGFSPFMTAEQLGHAQVVASAIPIPLALILLDEILVRQRMRWWVSGTLLALVMLLQFGIFEEYFVTALLFGALLFVLLLVAGRSRIRAAAPYAVRSLGLAAGMLVVLLAYPLYLQLRGPDVVHGAIHDPAGYTSDLLNFVLPTALLQAAPSQLFSITSKFPGNVSEQLAYLGIPLIVVVAVVIVTRWRSLTVRIAAIMGAASALLSLGPHLTVGGVTTSVPLPWIIPAHLPLLKNILPARLTLYMYLAAAILFAFALAALLRRRRATATATLLVAVVAATFLPTLPLHYQQVQVPSFFSTSAVRVLPQDAVVYAIPWPGPFSMTAMNGQSLSDDRFRILGGYFIGPASPNQDALLTDAELLRTGGDDPHLSDAQVQVMRSQLAASHVSAVMLTPALTNLRPIEAYLTTIFGPPTLDAGDVVVWLIGSQTAQP